MALGQAGVDSGFAVAWERLVDREPSADLERPGVLGSLLDLRPPADLERPGGLRSPVDSRPAVGFGRHIAATPPVAFRLFSASAAATTSTASTM
jgi:hypothetical protein